MSKSTGNSTSKSLGNSMSESLGNSTSESLGNIDDYSKPFFIDRLADQGKANEKLQQN